MCVNDALTACKGAASGFADAMSRQAGVQPEVEGLAKLAC
jgi:hypothetical protein